MNFNQEILQKNYGELFYSQETDMYWSYTRKFCKKVIKEDMFLRVGIFKKMLQIMYSPERQKHMSTNHKGEIEARLGEDRLYYKYSRKLNLVEFTEYSHKDKQKKR